MTTVLIWLGSGFAFSVGVCAGAFLMRFANRQPTKPGEFNADEATKLLAERNEIGKQQVKMLSAIADRLQEIEEGHRMG